MEVYHEEGKADGLDQYQVRDFETIGKHIALVAVTYSLLRAAPHDTALLHSLHRTVQTTLDSSAGAVRRKTPAQALWALAGLIQTGLAQDQTLKQVMQPILAAVASQGKGPVLPKANDELGLTRSGQGGGELLPLP